MKNQYLRIKNKLDKGYPNYGLDFLLELVQCENGFLLTFPSNFERALRRVKEMKSAVDAEVIEDEDKKPIDTKSGSQPE